MRSFISIALAALIIFCFSACGGGNNNATGNNAEASTGTTAAVTTTTSGATTAAVTTTTSGATTTAVTTATSGATSGSAAEIKGVKVESEIKSFDSKKGLLSAQYPENWHNHSTSDLLTGFLHFGGSEDAYDFGSPKMEVRCSYTMDKPLKDCLVYEGDPISFTVNGREWVGVHSVTFDEDAFELVADIGEGSHLSVMCDRLSPDSGELMLFLSSLSIDWD